MVFSFTRHNYSINLDLISRFDGSSQSCSHGRYSGLSRSIARSVGEKIVSSRGVAVVAKRYYVRNERLCLCVLASD